MLRTSVPLIGALGLMNKSPQKLRRRQERHFSAHNTYLRIAKLELDKCIAKQPGWMNSAFISITFSSLAIEAICNAVGDRVMSNWKDYERESPLDKIEILTKHLGLSHSWAKEPWKTVKWLSNLRNDLAHPKPERVSTDKIIIAGPKSDEKAEAPDSKLEKQITVGKARSAYKSVDALKILLCEKVPPEDSLGLFSDAWTTSTQIHHEA